MLLWFVTPFVTWWSGKPLVKPVSKLTLEQHIFLRKIARKTWSFFERFVGQEDNWLPPDNFQEQPSVQIAHRTSPTNIGLSLLASVTACEFGYLTTGQLIERTTRTMNTMKKMERCKGHFYNWYDTQTLEVLRPPYISTVDSGNLAGHLLTLRQGLLALVNAPVLRPVYLDGLEDTLDVLTESIGTSLPEVLNQFRKLLYAAQVSFHKWPEAIQHSQKLCEVAERIATQHQNSEIKGVKKWSQKLHAQCIDLADM